ncbi:MBL fold metallo-hydrolase [Parafrigoribacterium mesophilum]|uniref:MBL fold metallo-hydrolase n=1 Tax=Parafrigoribacterium mesophilum TaxID=433646 RepID=UPI0031FCD3C9
MSDTFVTYIGGPTVLLEYAGLRILTDPTFDAPGSYVEPSGLTLVKTVGPAIAVDQLGEVDLGLLSHHQHLDNLDHLGREVLLRLPLVLSTAKAAEEVGGPVSGLAPWASRTVGAVTVTATPALHGPAQFEAMSGPVIGFVLQAAGEPTVYISGDNASLELVDQIADRIDAVDVALLHAGAARIPAIDAALTMTSPDAAEAARILDPKQVVGIHTEDWGHLSETREQFVAAFAAADLVDLLVDIPRGVRVPLASS